MEILHRGHIGTEHKRFLDENRIKYEPWFSVKTPDQVRDYIFEIRENDSAFSELKARLTKKHTQVTTFFTEEERLKADWCIIRSTHSIERLRPEGFGWHREYYSDQCPNCGAGWGQISPFRIKTEPQLGGNQFSSFGSGFELFCTPLVLEEFEHRGINGFETRDIMLIEEKRASECLSQVVVPACAQPAIAAEFVEHERYKQTDCPICGRTWHTHYIRGMLPLHRTALKTNLDFQLTNEWFGSGANARREILVSRRVVQLIFEKQWKGVELTPIKAV